MFQQHRELAREAVRKSLVLLKNGKDVTKPFLPLDRKAKRILVAGKHADDLGFQCGGWTKTWEGMGGRITIGKLCFLCSNYMTLIHIYYMKKTISTFYIVKTLTLGVPFYS